MISVTLLTKNSSKYLREVLSALHDFSEVVVYDNGSKDDSIAIARSFPNVVVHEGHFDGFGPTHNRASSLAKNDWVLSIDSDEVVTPEMAKEILNTPLDNSTVYSFPRHNFYNGKWIRWCGWYPDRVARLYNRTKTRFTDVQVHEAIITDGLRLIDMKEPLIHYSYASHSDFLNKMQYYSDLFAKENVGKRASSPCKAVLHGLAAFFKAYVIKRGFMGGYEGFVISVYNGNTAFYKYLKLYEANNG